MKALICAKCGDIQALQKEWRTCQCGNTSARWTNSRLGTAEFKAKDKTRAFLLGLNNRLLSPAIRAELTMWEDFRQVHEEATKAPGYVFDKAKAGCWAVVVQIGTTTDVKWAKDEV